MAVELEKIAKLLEDAYEQIATLESEKQSMETKIDELGNELMLAKEAEDSSIVWGDKNSSFGHVADDIPSYNENAESRLDNFLSD